MNSVFIVPLLYLKIFSRVSKQNRKRLTAFKLFLIWDSYNVLLLGQNVKKKDFLALLVVKMVVLVCEEGENVVIRRIKRNKRKYIKKSE